MSVKKLIHHLNRMLPFPEEALAILEEKVKLKRLRRRQYLLQEGDLCKHYNFVLSGCLRMYQLDEKGSEHVLQFATEDWWISDIGSFHSERPSQLFIDALEPTEVLQISKQDLLFLYVNFPTYDRYFRVLVENAFINMQERVLQNISSTAEERYLSFLEKYPQLSNRISQIQIAAYIGVTPEFLSKIRKKMMG